MQSEAVTVADDRTAEPGETREALGAIRSLIRQAAPRARGAMDQGMATCNRLEDLDLQGVGALPAEAAKKR